MSNNWKPMPGGDVFPATINKQREILDRLVELLTSSVDADLQEIERLRQDMMKVKYGGSVDGK